MIFDGARDHDDDRLSAWLWLYDAACLLLAMVNAVAWPVLLYVLVAP